MLLERRRMKGLLPLRVSLISVMTARLIVSKTNLGLVHLTVMVTIKKKS